MTHNLLILQTIFEYFKEEAGVGKEMPLLYVIYCHIVAKKFILLFMLEPAGGSITGESRIVIGIINAGYPSDISHTINWFVGSDMLQGCLNILLLSLSRRRNLIVYVSWNFKGMRLTAITAVLRERPLQWW